MVLRAQEHDICLALVESLKVNGFAIPMVHSKTGAVCVLRERLALQLITVATDPQSHICELH